MSSSTDRLCKDSGTSRQGGGKLSNCITSSSTPSIPNEKGMCEDGANCKTSHSFSTPSSFHTKAIIKKCQSQSLVVPPKQAKVSFSPEISINVSSPEDKGSDVLMGVRPLPRLSKEYNVVLLGESVLDIRFTSHMLPWIIIEVMRRRSASLLDVNLQLTDTSLKATGGSPPNEEPIFEHKLKNICKFSKTHHDHSCFMYLTRESVEAPYRCYVFQADNQQTVVELFSTMKEITKEIIQQQHNSGLLSDGITEGLSKSTNYAMHDFQQFEVLYVGKIKVSHKRAPPTFIDDAVEKFKLYEMEKGRHQRERHGSGASITSLPGNIESKVSVQENNLKHQLDCLESNDSLSSGSDASLCLSISRSESSDVFPPPDKDVGGGEVPAYSRMRSLSGDNMICKGVPTNNSEADAGLKRPRGETWPAVAPSLSHKQNRTMLFLIGRAEVCMISPDKKSALLTKSFRDISHCSQGIKHSDHFGFICRETCLEGYISYIFKCQSEAVVDDIMLTLKQAFKSAHLQHQQQTNKSGPYVICNTCPMHWLHKVCIEIDGLNADRSYAVMMKKLDHLSESDQNEILGKLNESEVAGKQEKCEILMILLMAMCRAKQIRHKHNNLTDNTKPEFHIGGDRRPSSTFDNLKKKAKKSLTSSFENMLKRRSKEDVRDSPDKEFDDVHDVKKMHHQLPHWKSFDDARLANNMADSKMPVRAVRSANLDGESSPQHSSPNLSMRGRSSTIATVPDSRKSIGSCEDITSPKAPFMNIFMKVGNQGKISTAVEDSNSTPKKGSWRQAIFNRVVTPVKQDSNLHVVPESPECIMGTSVERAPLTKENLRTLWRKIILQQITLIRMEKENKKLQAQQDASSSKRIKLDYEEITPCLKEVTKIWDTMLQTDPLIHFSKTELFKAVKDGVPRHKRGEVWQFLARQAVIMKPTVIVSDIDADASYCDLLKDLTSHQHAILIDLGRTFPGHPYYSRPLGPGQLGLFNLLKAYSLLDKEVGYCQGLSFVTGVLLLHMEEDRAFDMMKHLMFRIGIRRQYKPDMVALQVQMYQLSRLIHDHHRDLYEHFELHDIAPTLYAAPWFLTLFASQFPLGFVSRLFDILLLQDFEVIFKVALILLGNHKELIMQCNGFETIMEFLKTTLPSLGIIQMERIFNQVFTLDISKQLDAFEVEYHVLQEEMILSPQKTEAAYQNLRRQNMELVEQLQVAHTNIHNLEHSIGSYQDTINKLQAQMKAMELERCSLLRTVVKLEQQTGIKSIEINGPAYSSNRQPSNDSSSYDDEDKEVAQTLNSNCVNRPSSCPVAISPDVEK